MLGLECGPGKGGGRGSYACVLCFEVLAWTQGLGANLLLCWVACECTPRSWDLVSVGVQVP